ncbi:DUF3846 domain-containing protein [Blautia sp. MCC283]|uniref:DUF3846 domain-containing protein n=1 Tax=Blautia sp. MCC283 TaxID=2592640 RepID=UPI001C030C68|nr:DUF3846 domain-containing protein [Blautia sp. MCC283]MBT9841472.1 DUF3846 domain-containing protein [Blautia sp. MCC283]
MKALLIKPGKKPETVDIEPGLESLQKMVDGNIQVVYPFEELVGLVMNEEGKMNGLPLNRALRDEKGEIYDIIAGDFLVVGLTEDDFGSLSDELIEKYYKFFEYPEHFAFLNGQFYSRPYTDRELQAASQED